METVLILALFLFGPILLWLKAYWKFDNKVEIFTTHLQLSVTFAICAVIVVEAFIWSIDKRLGFNHQIDVQILPLLLLMCWTITMLGVTDYYRYPKFRSWLNATVSFLTVITGIAGFIFALIV